jgi:hypothetical protein
LKIQKNVFIITIATVLYNIFDDLMSTFFVFRVVAEYQSVAYDIDKELIPELRNLEQLKK